MIKRMSGLAALLAVILGLMGLVGTETQAQPSAKDRAKMKEALQELQEFVGLWNLEGTHKVDGRTEAWKEKVEWSWKFKGDDAWMRITFAEGKGKHFTQGEIRYLLPKKKYQVTLTAPDKSQHVFEGTMKVGTFTLQRKDAATGDVHRIKLETLADGVRLVMKVEKQDGGKGLFGSSYQMVGNKDGESIAGTVKKPECVVTGGAASIAVSYGGKTYHVCCSGCRDAFNENPTKFVKKK